MNSFTTKIPLVALLVALTPVSAIAGAGCDAAFGTDAPAIIKVQSSWGAAERAIEGGHYARALLELRKTTPALHLIRNRFMRHCVAGGANLRIAAAQAGLAHLEQHPSYFIGAKKAANRAWVRFPMAHDCP